MAQRMGGITCDQCGILVDHQEVYIMRRSKKRNLLHFCSQDCLNRQSFPKDSSVKISDFITDEQATEFIHESNAIEEIHYDRDLALQEWKKKDTKVPELQGQRKALSYVLKQFKHTKLTISVIEKLHRLLMSKLLPKAYLGLRKDLVRVSGIMCPYPIAIKPMLEDWLKKVNAMKNPTEEEIWQTHLAYEYIHPFIDGNGRSGRLLWLWLRYKFGFNYKCIYNKTKFTDYYPQFNKFNWEMWKK
jgi:Fic family protein